ncbi:MAG: dienelactone hydrolase family protein [Formivibrio sp.]|nr:dienelactone hydrolase family protein [Formivibrio sp.]
MDNQLLDSIELATGENPVASVIWLHGLGADGNDFVPVVPELGLPANLPVRFIFPNAPAIPITCNNGYVMPGWYDITHFDQISRDVDALGVVRSVQAIHQLIINENQRGIPTNRIVLAGFSQGGAIAYTAGLTYPEKLAGIIALSTYIPAPELLVADSMQINHATPIFAAHGGMDPVVPIALGKAAYERLSAAGYPISWQTYPMQHSVCMPEIVEIGQFITNCLQVAPH